MFNVALFLPVLILSSSWPGAHPDEGQGASSGISFEQKRLAHLPNDSTLGQCVFGADGRRVAYEILEPSGGKVFVNGIGGELFEGPSGASRLRFSSDGRRLAYVTGRSGQMCAVIDGAKGKSYSRILDLNF